MSFDDTASTLMDATYTKIFKKLNQVAFQPHRNMLMYEDPFPSVEGQSAFKLFQNGDKVTIVTLA